MKLNLDVEIARLFGLACVITAHANSLGMFHNYQATGYVIDEMCRASVQLFFLVSGFFWKPEQIDGMRFYLAKLFPKVAIPFCIWAALYLFLDATELLYPQTQARTWFSYATTPWSGGIAFHLWFLPALFIGTAIGMALIRRIGLDRALWVVIGLFLVGSLLGTYSRPLGIEVPLSAYRNGIFFAPVFLVAGYYLKTMSRLPGLATFSAIALLGAGLNLAEGIYVFKGYPTGHDLSFATLPFGMGVFGMFLHLKSRSVWLAGWGRDVFGAYLAHVLILKILVTHLGSERGPLQIVLVIALTFVLSLIVSRLAKQNRFLRTLAP